MSSINFLSIIFLLIASASQSHQACSSIEPPEHGSVKITQNLFYEFSCENGYMMQGDPIFPCDSYDKGRRQKPKCVIPSQSHQACSSIEPPEHGSVKITKNWFYEFSCENGYMMQGDPIFTCDSYDKGGRQKPKCVIPTGTCPKPDPPENGKVECDEDLTPGKYCHYSCFDGYKLYGSPVRKCMLDNQMDGGARCDRIRGKDDFEELEDSQSEESFERKLYRTSDVPISHPTIKYPNPPAPSSPTYTKPTNDNSCLDLQCEQLCLIENGVPQCKCCAGYKINTDKRTCRVNRPDKINMNDCLRQQKKAGNVKPHQCPEGYIYNYTTKACMGKFPRLPSVSRPVPLRPIPRIESCSVNNGGCQHNCVTTDSGSVMCRCQNGYDLHQNGKRCIRKFPRLPSVSRPMPLGPISRIESCSVNNGGCQHNCVTTDSGSVMCTCQNGYELHRNGKHCMDIDECRINNFQCSHGCVNLRGTAYCTCPSGFTLYADKKTCIDIDECLQENTNRCQHYCKNTVGSYNCSCEPGYILIEGYKCQGCRRNSYWSYENNACVDCPRNSHSDSEGKTSLSDCVCNSGYIGSPGDYTPCEDIDECKINNFGCSHTCINIPGSAYCICPAGFMLNTDNKTCIDIDECSIKNGGCEGLCFNTEGSFDCVCLEGFTASSKDRYSCDDIDECSENNGGCEHSCINYRGGFYCACKPGYRLDSTLKNCTDIQCPKLAQPRYSHVDCKYKNMTLSEENVYPAGTKCNFICDKGFKNIKDDNKMKCQKDGTWKGTLPECKPQSCPPLTIPENAEIHPARCSKHGAKVKEKCTFSCRAGYILNGFPVFTCRNNLTWSKKDIPVCKPVKIQPVIKCPEDIQVTLLRGKATQNVTVPEPVTNVEYYEVHPSWITLNEPVEFPVGVTQVTFTANSSFSEIAQCGMTVTILDEEPPVFHYCPDSITIEGASGSGELVTWDTPEVTDNVELVSVFSILEPNVTLAPGTYLAEYVARDSSGNIAKCSFNISIVRMNCSDLRDPVHGKANCMEWMFGKLCSPECDDGYIRNPDEALYYSCDDSGIWEPNELISECLQFTLVTASGCQDNFELKTVELNMVETEVCIACPSNTVWSSSTRKCEK